MSSSGQAPNVSMDELLASIKSMIEGESTGVVPEGLTPPVAEQPADAFDDGIMDLTQIAKPPVQTHAPLPPETGIEEAGHPYPGDQQPSGADGEHASSAAQEAAAQIQDILGGMGAEMGGTANEMAGHGSQKPIDPRAQEPVRQAETPKSPFQGAELAAAKANPGLMGGADPLAGFDDMLAQGAGAPLQDATRGLGPEQHAQTQHPPERRSEGPLGGPDALAQAEQKPQDMRPAGQPGVDPAIKRQMEAGQPALHGHPGGGPMGHPPAHEGQGLQGPGSQGQIPFPGAGGMPPGQHGQPGHEHRDLRQESEYAMGQALRQADASLSAQPALQGQMPAVQPGAGWQQPQGQLPQGQVPQGQPPQGQHPYPPESYGHALPVPAAGRSMVPVAAQPMMVADPSVDQLPVEMRNNLEEIVKQLLKPLLREWLERNLPELLRGAVDEQGKIDPDRL